MINELKVFYIGEKGLMTFCNKKTVFQHFTTSFRFFPWLHTITIKPWQVDRVRNELKIREYDDIFEEYAKIIKEMKVV